MAQLSFDWDWMDAPGVNGPELAATWARLRIKAGKSTVTRVLDERAKTVREHLYVPLYPMAEWLAANWWFLAERQQSNRAFAAEFLAPAVGLRNRVRRARLDEDDIDELAAEFGVSSMVIEHQLANHRIAKLPVGRPRAA